MGWELDNSSWSDSTFTISGNSNSAVKSPELDINMPFSSYKFQSTQLGDVIAFVSIDRGNWTQVNSSSQRIDLDKPSSMIQVRYEGLGNGWSVDDIRLQLYPSRCNRFSAYGY